ncbi:MAG TPA: APC family permease [Allosphingosinicella sp.]|jgi:amino acid transporter
MSETRGVPEEVAGGEGEAALRREIGFLGSAFLAFNGVVGAGIFALPESLLTQFGTFSPWLFPLFGGLVLLIAVPFARVASYFPLSGGPVLYTARFGPLVSFQVGWLYYVARVTALAANSNLFVTYAASLWPPLSSGVPRGIAILALCGGLTLVNIVGVRRAIRTLDALTLVKAAPLVAMAIWGLAVSADPVPAFTGLPPLSGVEAAALLVLYAFVGFENSVVPAGETANARRTIPRALIVTVVATIALYLLVQLAYVAVMAPGSGGDAPLVAFGIALAGPAGGLLLTAAALASLAGNLSGSMTSTPRATFALARKGLLPAWFGRVSERYHTPANSILFMGAAGALLALTGSFVWLAVVSTLARLFVYGLSLAALPGVQREAGERPGRALYPWLAGGLAVCFWAMLQSQWPAWRMLLALVAVGSLLYWLARRPLRRR